MVHIQKSLSIPAHSHLVPISLRQQQCHSWVSFKCMYIINCYIYMCVCVIFSSFNKRQHTELTDLYPGKPGSQSPLSGPRDNVVSAVPLHAYLYFLHPL